MVVASGERFRKAMSGLRCQRAGLEGNDLSLSMRVEMRGIRDRCKRFAQNLLCASIAFAAAIAHTQFFAQVFHRTRPGVDGETDFLFRNVIADTDDHGRTLP
jgi:hypothetical protein